MVQVEFRLMESRAADNFTVSMWLRPDEDMSTYASALTSSDGTGGSSSGRFQISDNGSGGIVAITNNRDKRQTNAQLTLNNWSHVVAVKYDNGTLGCTKMALLEKMKSSLRPPSIH